MRRFTLAALAVWFSSCSCSDPSTLGFTACASSADCAGDLGACCDGFCRASCSDDGGAGGGGGSGGAGGGGGGMASVCIPECGTGQRCIAGNCECDAVSCPSGCCSGAACTSRTLGSCAAAGKACVGCDTAKADRCSSTGACQCGATGACGAGLRCVNTTCVCDQTSCPAGCCMGNVCVNPTSGTSCGAPGAMCGACNADKANACSATGACRCGTDAECGPGQVCGLGGCVCNLASCPNGCCNGNQCTAPTVSTCGAPGAMCQTCSTMTADKCSATGSCACGTGGACGTGQRCANGTCVCDSTSCTNGCCAGKVCTTRTATACAPNGQTCAPCDPTKANSCSTAGNCRCGMGPACGPAQTCSGGVCTGGACNAANCPAGCCDGNQMCQTRTLGTCGIQGSACTPCDAAKADACSAMDGACKCGPNNACGTGQRCSNGSCVCDATTCPTGCCSGTTCTTTTSGSACGGGGAACISCPASADRCTNGSCVCGLGGAACADGQRCVNGACVCDATSCADGCCDGQVCLRPPALGKCGFGGLACAPCDPTKADTCDAAGLCRCGGTNPCGNNQQCVGGQCVCNAASCPNGCCNSGVCTTPTTVSLCGKPGLACTSCNATLADSCLNGDCSCGSLGAVCASGQRCVSGTCVCDATSCPNGCCKGANQCLSPSNTSQCGLGGVACQTCGTGQTCPNGACVGAPTPDGGSGTGGGSGSGGGTGGSGGSGGGGLGLVDHLDVVQNTLVVDAGACVQFQIQAKDAMGAVVPYVGLGLSYGFQPEPRGVDAYQDALCTIPPGRFTAGMLTQNGYLVAPSFGRATVYPTVIPATNYTQGKALAVDSYATLTGFPSQLPYGVCTSIVLSANAGALDDTTLTRSVAGGAIGFSQGFNCAGTMSPVILAGTKSVNVKVRTLSGGTIRVAGNPNVLRFTDVPVTLIRADGGAACLGLGAACAGDSVCCTDDCDNVLGCR